MKYEKSELEEAFRSASKRQSYFGSIFGSVLGSIAGGMLFIFLGGMGGPSILMAGLLLVPGVIIGFFAQYLGRAFELKYRVIPGFTALVLHVLFCFFLAPFNPILLLLALPNSGIAVVCSKARLTDIEKTAVWQRQLNLKQQGVECRSGG